MYLLKVYLLVIVPVFGFAGVLIAARLLWNRLLDFSRARFAAKRIAMGVARRGRTLTPATPLHETGSLDAA